MNNTFNLQRFGLLLRRQWLEFGKIYLISLVVLLGIFLVFYGYNYYQFKEALLLFNVGSDGHRALEFRIPMVIVSGLIFGTLVASTYFSHLGQKPKAVIDLMIPASTFEKFLGGIVYTSFLSTICFLALFYFTDLAFVSKMRSVVEEYTKAPIAENQRWGYFFDENNPNDFKALYFVPFLITSIFLFGSIYFNRFHYIKTAISLMIFSGLWTLIIAKAGEAFFDGRTPIRGAVEHNNGKDQAELWISLILIGFSLIFWAFTYLRLKEKQV